MLKNLYDTDCVTWSPQGKLFQVEYAMEAVKLGSVCLGLKSQTNVVLCSVKRSQQQFANHQDKVFKIDSQIGMAMSGLTSDARLLCKYMRNECLNHLYTYESPHPLQRLISKVADKSQLKTSSSGKRPYGVGLLIIGKDQQGVHLYETSPDGNYYEYLAHSIGARSQSARTYLENQVHNFNTSTLNQLILHGLKALKGTVQEDNDFNPDSIEVAYIDDHGLFQQANKTELQNLINQLQSFNADQQMEIIQ